MVRMRATVGGLRGLLSFAKTAPAQAPELMETLRSRARPPMADLPLRRTAFDLMRCILPALTRLWISITTVRSSGYSRLCHAMSL